jgi:hypothetical protein
VSSAPLPEQGPAPTTERGAPAPPPACPLPPQPDRPARLPNTLPADRRLPRADRLDVDHPAYVPIVSAHEAALDAGRDTYRDPLTGLQVFTAGALWARGLCCQSGCRHCPYGVVARTDCCATGCAGCPVTEAYEARRRTG